MDKIYQQNPNTDEKRGKQTNKRTMQNEESASNKKKKFNEQSLNKRSLNIFKPEVKRNTTFANDRLKRLRNNISSEVIPFSTTINPSVLKNNICSSSYIGRNRTENKHKNSCEHMTKSLLGNKKFNTPGSTNEHQIHSRSFAENYTLTGREMHHNSEPVDQIQLKVDATISKGGDPVLSSFVDDNYELLQRESPIKVSCKIRKELRNTSCEKDSNKANFVKKNDFNKLKLSVNEETKSEIILNMRESPSRSISPFKLPGRTVGSENGSLNISITNSCVGTENSKNKTLHFPDNLNVETTLSMYSPNERTNFEYITKSKSPKKPHGNQEIHNNSVNSRLLHIRADISENKVGTKKMSNSVDSDYALCISNTFVPEPPKHNCSSSLPIVNKSNITNSPSKKSTLNRSCDIIPTNSRTEETTKYDTMENKSRKNHSQEVNVNSFKNSSKYWINYGQLIDSFYAKYFGTEKDIKKISSTSKDKFFEGGESSTHVDQLTDDEDTIMDWDDDDVIEDKGEISNPSPKGDQNCLKQEMYIVVDTNIFLSDLNILKEIVACGSNGKTKAILYVPWMVLTELDFMKDDRNTAPQLRKKVNEAVNFINKSLLGGGRKLIGQNIFEAESQKYIGKAPDDKIVSCCLQAKQNKLDVLLLSNDINLKNKLLINGIPALSTAEMFKNPIVSSPNHNSAIENEIEDKFQKINEKMSNCCSYIICECAEYAYGKVWNRMDMLKNPPPWTLSVCLKIFQKYWSSVFRERLLKQCLRAVEQLDIFLKRLEYSRNTENFDEFVQECLSLCIFLKDLEEHKNFVEDTIKDINSITHL